MKVAEFREEEKCFCQETPGWPALRYMRCSVQPIFELVTPVLNQLPMDLLEKEPKLMQREMQPADNNQNKWQHLQYLFSRSHIRGKLKAKNYKHIHSQFLRPQISSYVKLFLTRVQ